VMRLKTLLPRSLHTRISLLVFGLIFIFGLALYVFHYHYWRHAAYSSRQQVNWSLAEELAQELRPLLKHGFLNHELHRRMAIIAGQHPETDMYVLDKEGYPLAVDFVEMKVFRENSRRIPPQIVEEFLRSKPSRELPLRVEDPFVKDRYVVFSAARIEINDQPGYLFLNLTGINFFAVMNGIVDEMLIYGGILGGGFLWLLTAAIAFLVLLELTKRLRNLSSVVLSFSKGSYDARVEVKGSDEVSDLATTFNQMADRIVGSMDDLAEADRKRREIVAHISHDLGRPIASIQGYLETIVEQEIELTPEQQNKYLKIVLRNTYSLKQQVNDLFELSKLEAREILPEKAVFSLLETVTEEILPKLYPLTKEKNVTLRAEHPQCMNMVLADVAMIERVISNLVENAIRYSGENGQVVVSLRETDLRTTLEVSDTGPGISKEEQERIFKPFCRGTMGRDRNTQGTGLGLAIVKEILSAHGENITVESSPGKGSKFLFSLPQAKTTPDASDSSDFTKERDR